MAKKKVSRVKIKKKLWFKLLAPENFGKQELGECYLTSVEDGLGRQVRVSLKDLTGSIKDQNVLLTFKAESIDGKDLITKLIKYELNASSVKRSVRKETDRIDNVKTFTSKDGEKIQIKSFIVTRGNIQRSLRTNIMNSFNAMVEKELAENSYATLVDMLVGKRIQSSAKKELAKLMPLKEVSVRAALLK